MATFPDRLRQLIEVVFGPLSAKDGLPEGTIARAEKRLGIVRLPRVLREYFRLAGAHRSLSRGEDRILRPAELHVDNGGLILWEDEQYVCFAGVLLGHVGHDDPPVKFSTPAQDWWVPEARKLSRYLLAMTCWKACGELPASACGRLTPAGLARLKSALRWTSQGRGDPERLGFWGEGLAAFAEGNDLSVAAVEGERVEALSRQTGLKLRPPR